MTRGLDFIVLQSHQYHTTVLRHELNFLAALWFVSGSEWHDHPAMTCTTLVLPASGSHTLCENVHNWRRLLSFCNAIGQLSEMLKIFTAAPFYGVSTADREATRSAITAHYNPMLLVLSILLSIPTVTR